ncbi:hypothetical protein TNIN_304141 [Trichonephila inaurata madagascariensis]|uniref:Uncharacterized protein n=1 Tax=Trichonephila inaurata madagascariensis TaxID=2747483 RepID=A0A8X7C6X3_9ARAC|nr:hypothetical protein TNIN_304141 [Trichonephila inaurata madagascariensis]
MNKPDKSADLFVKEILCAVKERIHRRQVKKHLPFWKEFLDLLNSERNAATCRATNSHNITDCIILRKAQAKLKNAIILFKRTFAANLDFRKDGPREHSFISRLNNEKSSQHWEPITINGKLLTSPTKVATVFSKNHAAISRLHITAKNRKSIYDKGLAPSPTEPGFLLLNKNFS